MDLRLDVILRMLVSFFFFRFMQPIIFLPTNPLTYFPSLRCNSWQLYDQTFNRPFCKPSECVFSTVNSPHSASSPLKSIGPSGRVPPIIRQGPSNQTVSRGATAQLHCRVIGGPSVKISWEKDGERLLGNKPRQILMENGTLQITDIKVCVCVC